MEKTSHESPELEEFYGQKVRELQAKINSEPLVARQLSLLEYLEDSYKRALFHILERNHRIDKYSLERVEQSIGASALDAGVFSEREAKDISQDASRILMTFALRNPSEAMQKAALVLSPTLLGDVSPLGEMWGFYNAGGELNYSGSQRIDAPCSFIQDLSSFTNALGSHFMFYLRNIDGRDSEGFHIDYYSPERVFRYLNEREIPADLESSIAELKDHSITQERFTELMVAPKMRGDVFAGIMYAFPFDAVRDYARKMQDVDKTIPVKPIFRMAGEPLTSPDGSQAYSTRHAISIFKTWPHPNPEVQAERERRYNASVRRKNFCIVLMERILGDYKKV